MDGPHSRLQDFSSSRWARPIYSIFCRVKWPGPSSRRAVRVNGSEQLQKTVASEKVKKWHFSFGSSMYDYVLVLATDKRCHLAISRNAVRLHHHHLHNGEIQTKGKDTHGRGVHTVVARRKIEGYTQRWKSFPFSFYNL